VKMCVHHRLSKFIKNKPTPFIFIDKRNSSIIILRVESPVKMVAKRFIRITLIK
jgi:hypothetical protein